MSSKIRMMMRAAALAALVAMVMEGCRKWSHNGDLDGQWQVIQVTYSGVPVDFPEGERFYYDFYLNTFQLGFTDMRPTWLRGNFVYDESRLALDFPYIKEGRLSAEWTERLVYWGVPDSGEMDMHIRTLDGKTLVMEYDDVVITCRKF